MEEIVVALIVLCSISLIMNLVIVGRFIDLVEGFHKRESRKK